MAKTPRAAGTIKIRVEHQGRQHPQSAVKTAQRTHCAAKYGVSVSTAIAQRNLIQTPTDPCYRRGYDCAEFHRRGFPKEPSNDILSVSISRQNRRQVLLEIRLEHE